MRNLLAKQEHRWYHFIEILTTKNDWVILSDLSSSLDCSDRILKMDINNLNESFEDFQLLTSNKGVKIEYNTHYSFKTFCQKILNISDTYRLLEVVFLNDGIYAKDCADRLDVSLSTLYRMVDQVNEKVQDSFNFKVETGPCRITGDEESIRFFFYTYFNEKYRHSDLPFNKKDQEIIDILTDEFVRLKDFPYDFIYFNIVRVVGLVNYTRFKNNYKIDTDVNPETIKFLLLNDLKKSPIRGQVEAATQMTYNEEFIGQVLRPFVNLDVFHSQDVFQKVFEQNTDLYKKIKKLKQFLAVVSANNSIPILNIDKLTYAIYNIGVLEYSQPLSRHILYDRNSFFVNEIKVQFPEFYKDLYKGIAEYQIFLGREPSEFSINYYIFTIFIWWENLVGELLKKLYQVNILVISDRHQSHARMMKEYLKFEYGDKVDIHTSDLFFMNTDDFDLSQFDLIVSSFTDKRLMDNRTIYVGNMLNQNVIKDIQSHIDAILVERSHTTI